MIVFFICLLSALLTLRWSIYRYSSNYIPSREVNLPGIYSVYSTTLDMDILTRPLNFNGYIVPSGYKTDMTTTYWFIRWFVPRYSKANIASVIHDFHYTNGGVTNRAAADEIFRIHLMMTGMSASRARLYWVGVRIGGYWGWNNSNKQRLNAVVLDQTVDLETGFTELVKLTGNKHLGNLQ